MLCNYFKVSDTYKFCSTRQRGKNYYNVIINNLQKDVKLIIIDFNDIEHISLSFIDEVLVLIIKDAYILKMYCNDTIAKKIIKCLNCRNLEWRF